MNQAENQIPTTTSQPVFDPAYVAERNKLIPIAERFADEIHGRAPSGTEEEREVWCAAWNRTFHTKMNQLWKERNN